MSKAQPLSHILTLIAFLIQVLITVLSLGFNKILTRVIREQSEEQYCV